MPPSDGGRGLFGSLLGAERGRPWVVLPALAAILVGMLVTGFVAWRVEVGEEAGDLEALERQGQELANSVGDAVDIATERLIALGSFYQGSDEVSHDEFTTFISNFDDIPGMGGLGHMHLVAGEDLVDFETRMREEDPDFFAWELDSEGNRMPVAPRNTYALVEYFEPSAAFNHPQGFDSFSEANRRSALTRARLTREPTATPLLQLLARTEQDGFLLYWPVTSAESGAVVGFTLAPMDLGDLIAGQADEALVDELDWEVESIVPGRDPEPTAEGSWDTILEVGGNNWLLTVSPGDDLADPIRASVALVVTVGSVITVFSAVAVYLYRRKLEAQRELARLQDLSKAKDHFLASVSHELRTPLTSVVGFAHLLRDSKDELSEQERAAMIANMASEAADLSSIIDDLLVSARSELNSLALTRVPVSLRAQVSQVLESLDGTTGQGCDFVNDGAGLVAEGDPGRVRQIVRNLVTNAARYGGDRIQIRFGGDEGESVYLEVADDGPGIPDEEWEQIFRPYYRAHDSATQPAAIGIGLSVARQLARLMDGDLTYGRVGEWSVFRLTLPQLDPRHRPSEVVAAASAPGSGGI